VPANIPQPLAPQDDLTGQTAWEAVEGDALAAAAALPDQLPRLDLRYAAQTSLSVGARLAGDEEEIVLRFAKAEGQAIGHAIDRLPRLAHAMFYVASRYATATGDTSRQELLAEAQELRSTGLQWMEVVEAAGAIPAGTTGNLRSGQGHLDTAGDLQSVAAHLVPLWPLLEPLQAMQPDPGLRLTRARIDRMAVVGTQLLSILNPNRETPWRRALIGTAALLAESYGLARDAAT